MRYIAAPVRRKADYHYELPSAQIAQVPADRRDASRLLHLGPGGPEDRRFCDLPELLPEGAVLVVNDTKVVPARLFGRKPTGGRVELLLLEPAFGAGASHRWRALARASKPLRAGQSIDIAGAEARLVEAPGEGGQLVVELDRPADELLQRAGEAPLPPYIERASGPTDADRERYQTIYARHPGAVAAPTAGLHFTAELLRAIEARGAEVARLTLHVGLGTFAPMRREHLDEHRMHAERYTIPPETARLVASGRPVVAVGTTAVRALEAAALEGLPRDGAERRTDLFITPGFRFQVVDHLVTNFHLPESSLLVLVCAFGGRRRVLDSYLHAVSAGYRFYSYGDAMLLSREGA